jgi:AAA domain, putative AbiEii toxin, Type IV TA system
MTDSTNEKRPLRKLTVKNFSVIKEAELEFGKITVLIGPQASGKSLLAKLAFFFAQIVPESGVGSLLLRIPFDQFQEAVRSEFIERFPKVTWNRGEFHISYVSEHICFSICCDAGDALPTVEFENDLRQRYDQWVDSHKEEGSARSITLSIGRGEWVPELPIQPEGSIYIPTGRAFFSTPNKGFAASVGKNLDWITQRFATEIDWDFRSLVESSAPSSDLLPQFLEEAAGVLGGRVIRQNGDLLFESTTGERKLPFQLLSSGTLELLPLLNPLANLVSNISTNPIHVRSASSPIFGPVFVEEPELSIFPGTQYELMRLFTWMSEENRLDFQFVITTHSPYILTAFNNLIEAGQAARNNPNLRDEVAKIIPEQYWIKEGDFKAYSIDDGKLESILNQSGFIEANYLDQVSEVIGNEFDKLLRLEYEHTKAS